MNNINEKYHKAVEELYRAKDFFLNRFCDEERVRNAKVFITIQSSGRKNNLGHFWANRWDGDTNKKEEDKEIYHEINICAERMNRPVNDIFSTFLHELSHLHNNVLGIEDCNSSQYHNKHFKSAAQKFGLNVDKFPGRGWALTSLSEEGISAVEAFQPNREALSLCRIPVEKVQKENPYITISLKKEEYEAIFEKAMDEWGVEKPKDVVKKLLDELDL
jgi:hypothetical protein